MQSKTKCIVLAVLVIASVYTALYATQYTEVTSTYTFSINTKYSSLQIMASDKSPNSDGYLLKNENGVYSVNLGKWSKGANKQYTSAFAIVNTEKNAILRITKIEVSGSGTANLNIGLHKHMDKPVFDFVTKNTEEDDDYLIYYKQGTSYDHSSDGFVLCKGNGYDGDSLQYTNQAGNSWVSASFDSSNVWLVNPNLIDANTLTKVSASSSNFVWVEVSISNPASEGDYSGTITIFAKSISLYSDYIPSEWKQVGESEGDNFGWCISGEGDVNGDGFKDLFVSAPNYGSNKGMVYLYLGSASGLSDTPDWTAVGENSGDYFGKGLSYVGDVNDDGYNDVIISAPGKDSNKGKVDLYLGSASGLLSSPSWTAIGENSGDYFGRCVASAGDVNGDGYDDVIISAGPSFDLPGGKVYLYLGSASGLSDTLSWTAEGENGDWFGYCIALARDVSNDGYDDIIISNPAHDSFKGKVYVYYGSSSGLSSTADWTATGEGYDDCFGNSVSPAGDVNGDGYYDILVSAPYFGSNDNGKVYLYLGSENGLLIDYSWSWEGESGDHCGEVVAFGGDTNGDGYHEIYIGAPSHASNRGRGWGFFGSPNEPLYMGWQDGENEGDFFTWGISYGDCNGDGYDNAIVSAKGYDSNRGKVYFYP